MTGLLPHINVEDLRGLDLLIAAGGTHLPAQLDQLVEDGGAGGQPERGAGRDLREPEHAQLRAETTMIIGAGALEPLEVGVELLLGEEGSPIHAREHLAV